VHLGAIVVTIFVVLGVAAFWVGKNQTNNSASDSAISSTSQVPSVDEVSPAQATPDGKSKTVAKASSIPTAQVTSSVRISSISPGSANSGQEIKIFGSGFGTGPGKVLFYNQIMGSNTPFMDVNTTIWSETKIHLTIPPAVGGQTIDVEVVNRDGTKSNRSKFMIQGGQPRIDGISPSNAQPLQQITISGKEFGSQSGRVSIYRTDNYDLSTPNYTCSISSWANDQIKCNLPSEVSNGTEYGFAIESSDGRKSSFTYYRVGN
jgi:hypothetical protein